MRVWSRGNLSTGNLSLLFLMEASTVTVLVFSGVNSSDTRMMGF